ncbi:hypothetical protein KU306_12145 [Haloferax larsenii]|uniref:Uncharacterized protein n=1 Tax=Haloferax larsenii TaxID=302484 RepID=A0ABY5REP6_HALLR|nr:hypothetical protein [Haloferax larsenii]UVE49655.1 hypothetical protein KU306_12145 [Haloferax larsenii]
MAQYVLHPDAVEGCMWDLAEEKIHRHFGGYLGMLRTAEVEGKTDDLFFDYEGFFDAFFKVRDDGYPYLVPFDTTDLDDREDFWFNDNVGGSYSTSSIRDDLPFSSVVDYGGRYADRWWTLKDNHHEIAFEEMLEREVPVEPLAGFLYRDFAIELDEGEPSIDHYVRIFREEFGLVDDEGEPTEVYNHLFRSVDFDYDSPFEAAQHG